MSQNGPNPHEVPGSFGSQPAGSWQSGPGQPGPQQGPAPQQGPGPQPGPVPQAPTPDYSSQQYPHQPYPGQQYPNQPYPNQQYPGQPDPGQQYPNQQYPGQPNTGPGQGQQWGYPPPNQNQPRKPNRALIGVIGGVVGVALIGGTVYAVQNSNSGSPTTSPRVSSSASVSVPQPTVPTAKASDAVASYLRALGAGDATTVLSLAATQPGDSTFLTNAVLAKTTAGKITDVSVPEVTDANATSVSATYTLGGKAVTTSFPVTNVQGQFRLSQIATEVDLSTLARVPITLAGVRPTSDQVALFPGVYPVRAANSYYSLGSVKVTVADLEDLTPDASTLALSSDGRAAIIKAATAKYKSCLKQNSTAPKGCAIGVRMPTGVKIRTSTIAWTTRSGAKWSKMKPKLLSTSVAEAAAPAKVHFYARDARVSGRYWFKDVTITGVRALISGKKLTISFY